MRVLFLNSSRAGKGNIPLNIPMLIAVMRKNGHEVRLFDLSDYAIFSAVNDKYQKLFFKAAKNEKEADLIREREEFYLKKGVKSPGKDLLATDYREDFEEAIRGFRPDLIAAGCLSSDFKFLCEFMGDVKKKFDIPVLVGGIHAILNPEEMASEKWCDYLCVGEGENSVVELLEYMEGKRSVGAVGGVWIKRSGETIEATPHKLTDLKSLPPPDYSDFDPEHFYRPFDGRTYKMLNYEFSRGCPYNCTYCVNISLKEKYKGLGSYSRIKEIDQSMRELKELVETYKFDFIRFWDEDFTAINADVLEEYAERYKKDINLPFLIYSRVESINERKVRILKDMGCKTFAIGIESGSEFIRKKVMNRRMSNEEIITKFGVVKSFGVRVSAYNMIGLPFETREMIFETIMINRKVKPDSFSVTFLEPYKGVPIRKMCEEEGLSGDYVPEFNNRTQFVPRGMSREEMQGLFRTFSLYIRLPEKYFDKIRLAEKDDAVYEELLGEAEKYK